MKSAPPPALPIKASLYRRKSLELPLTQNCYLWRQRDRVQGRKTMERFIFLSFGLLVVALCLRGTGADPQCPFDWSSYNEHCYKVFKVFKSWHDAEITCRQQEEGSHLVSIQSWAESAYVARLVSNNVVLIHVWIGLSDPWKQRIWYWSDGSRSRYKSWKRGEPNNLLWNEYCVELWSFSGYLRWNDQYCGSKRYFVCKFQPQGEGSTD